MANIALILPLIAAGTSWTGPIIFGAAVAIAAIGSLLSGIFGGSDAKALGRQVLQLRDTLTGVAEDTVRFAWSIAFALGALLRVFEKIWVEFLTRIWALLKSLASQVAKLVKDVLPALVKAVKQARYWLDKIYKDYIRPILNTIQIVRRYLAILKALHVPFADKIDKLLVRIQARIIGPYLYALRLLNGVGTWVNFILTAGGLIQKPIFLNSMYAYGDTWINLFWAAQAGASGQPPTTAALPRTAPPTYNQVVADWDTYKTSGGGRFAQVIAQANQYADKAQAS